MVNQFEDHVQGGLYWVIGNCMFKGFLMVTSNKYNKVYMAAIYDSRKNSC